MKRLLFALLVVVLALAFAAPAVAKEMASGAWISDSENQLRRANFRVVGSSTDVTGHVSIYRRDKVTGDVSWYEGEVEAYWQEGNRAAFAGRVTAVGGDYFNSPTARTFMWRVVDNGQGAKASPDQYATIFTTAESIGGFDLSDWDRPLPWSENHWEVRRGNIRIPQ